jgi:hypothetical protein
MTLWKREKNRILGACIIAMFVFLLLAIIWIQRGQIERLVDENARLKDEVGELGE